jgi:hypothetical protein
LEGRQAGRQASDGKGRIWHV